MFNKNNLLKLVAVLGVIFVAMIFGYYYYEHDDSKPIVTIYPDPEPTKIKPQEAGGLVIPNSDNTIYDSLQSQKTINKKVNILPEPEAPINIVPHQTLGGENLDPLDNILASIIADEENETKAINRDEPVPDIILPEIVNASTKLNEVVEETPNNSNVKKGLNVVKITTKTNKLEHEKTQSKKKLAHYKIQLASVKSESDAIKEGERIKAKNIKILNKANKCKIHFFAGTICRIPARESKVDYTNNKVYKRREIYK